MSEAAGTTEVPKFGGGRGGRGFGRCVSVRRYTLADGLAGMQVEDVCQDRRGLLWIATADGGISRFDGVRFDNFGTADGLPHPTVMTIAEDGDGRLWFGTLGGGLACFEDGSFRAYSTEHGLPSNEILGLQPREDGSLRVLTGAGVGWFAEGRCRRSATAIDGRPIGRVYDMADDPGGTTWLATQHRGVITLDGRSLDLGDGGGAVPCWAWKFARDCSGRLWIAFHASSGASIGCYDPSEDRLELIDLPSVLPGSEVSPYGARHVRVDDRGWVWVGRRRDLVVYDGAAWHSCAERVLRSEAPQVRLTCGDREGNLWVSLWNGGLVLCDPLSREVFTEADGLPDRLVRWLEEDGDRLWIRTDGGVACLEDGSIRRMEDGGDVPVAGRGGPLRIGREGRAFRTTRTDLPREPDSEDACGVIPGLLQHRDGTLWLFAPDGNTGRIEGDRAPALEQAFRARPYIVLPAGEGGFWIGVEAEAPALYRMDRDHRLRALEGPGLDSIAYVSALCEQGSTLWVGTNIGLFAVDSLQGVRRFTREGDGLPTNNILSLAVDGRDRLWIGLAGGGVLRYDGRSFCGLRLGPSAEENTVKAILCDRRGRLWFGTAGGLILYRPRPTPPGLVIRRVAEGCLLEVPEGLSWPEGASEHVLHFQGLQFRTVAGPMSYSHRLVGHGPAQPWSEFAPDDRVEYHGLPAGEYRFEVRARNQDDLVSETARLEVKVVPGGGGARPPAPERGSAPVPSGGPPGPALSRVLSRLGRAARTGMTLLLAGETGTGKSLLAGEVHARSPRREQPLVRVSCGALPRDLVESELFGREQGVAGAPARQTGCFERAHGGTLHLDGIGDLPPEAQRALLTVLEDGRLRRVGGSEPIQVDVRVIAETNRDLGKAVREGIFRQDLYYRLNEFPVVLPPLRDRREEIPVLAAHFAADSARHLKRTVPSLSDEALTHLQGHSWPGNVRELEHAVRRAVVLCEGDVIEVSDLPLSVEAPADDPPVEPAASEEKDEKRQILEALRTCNWIVSGDRGAARLLGMHPEKLRYRMSKYGIRRPKRSS